MDQGLAEENTGTQVSDKLSTSSLFPPTRRKRCGGVLPHRYIIGIVGADDSLITNLYLSPPLLDSPTPTKSADWSPFSYRIEQGLVVS